MTKQRTIESVSRLRNFHLLQEEGLVSALRRWVEDPLKPKTLNGALRINPIFLVLLVIMIFAAGTFLFFSVIHP